MKSFLISFMLLLIVSLGSASHKKHKASKGDAESIDSEVATNEQWPNPSAVSGFGVPEGFVQGGNIDEGNTQTAPDAVEGSSGAGKHHGKSKHVKHNH